MNRYYRRLAPLLLASLLTGCGSILATFESDTIENDPGERSVSQQVLDETIETKAVVNIHAADEAFDDSSFTVVSFNGYVLIAGEVRTQPQITTASDVVRKIDGVRRIYNELSIAPNSESGTVANDVWLTAKVKTRLFTAASTPSLRVKVVTENSVVYLMGLLTPEEADRVAEVASEIDGVEKVVRLFELI